MPNQDKRPRYSDPDHPYSGSGSRYQNRYSVSDEYRRGDGPFQFPWWAIVIGFVAWFPLGFLFIWLNSAMRKGLLGGFEQKARRYMQRDLPRGGNAIYAPNKPENAAAEADEPGRDGEAAAAAGNAAAPRSQGGTGLITGLSIAGVALLVIGLLALPDGIYWLPDALAEGGYYWRWVLEELVPVVMLLTGGVGCLFGAHTIRTSRRMRKKIDNIVGDSKNMRIADIAAAIPCSYDKCCKYLEQCIDDGVFGPDAYLDMRRRYLVVEGKAPEPEPKKKRKSKAKETPEEEKDQYQKMLDELRAVNDAIPDEEMSDKIDRLEAVSAKIFEQAKTDPDKLPRMRKFMDYYLPTSLKLLQTYAELDAQGVEGENISESKRRIEETMDTLVHAFETQLDQLFQEDALDVSADIDVMEHMLRADGLTGEAPFKL